MNDSRILAILDAHDKNYISTERASDAIKKIEEENKQKKIEIEIDKKMDKFNDICNEKYFGTTGYKEIEKLRVKIKELENKIKRKDMIIYELRKNNRLKRKLILDKE